MTALDDFVADARAIRCVDYLTRKNLWSRAMNGDAGVPCPGCGGRDRFAVNARKNVWNCRRSGESGDAIALARHIFGFDFWGACEDVLGAERPGRDAVETAAERAARERRLAEQAEAAARQESERAKAADYYREKHRRQAYEAWRAGTSIAGTAAAAYLAERRQLQIPPDAHLRFGAEMPYLHGGQTIATGPALLAAITAADGHFLGLHRTWIDLDQPKGKAQLADPATGEILPAKKVLGPKTSGAIVLHRPPAPRRAVMGEGIETGLAVYSAERRAGAADTTEYLAAVDLGNMAGKAAGRLRHPTAFKLDKRGRGRPLFVPDATPAADDSAPPALSPTVTELVLLGDGDSEPFFTEQAMLRAAARQARVRPDLDIKIVMAPPGADFDDVWRQRAAA